ncbi:VTT domain-containing protein [Streptomyces sp. NPDC048290]|uniref:VTT domain-containing protein n=1 Tax=Streptomyces sp. NPDC048290 TaxID=3155811 RepID=UPI003423DA53
MAETRAPAPAAGPGGSTRTVRLLLRLDRAAHRRWFLPALAVFPLSDYALPVLPNQMLLAGLSALHPRRWRVIALTFVTASVLGAFLVATAVHAAGPPLLETVGAVAPGQAELKEVAGWVERHGGWALAVLALLPWTPRAAVVMCALAGIPPWTVALAVLAGRPLPVTLLALAGARAPGLLRRSRRIDRVLREVEAGRRAVG